MSLTNPEPDYDPKIRRQMVAWAVFGGLIMAVLLCALLASFSGFLPGWVSGAACAATGVASWLLTGHSEALRKRLRSPRH